MGSEDAARSLFVVLQVIGGKTVPRAIPQYLGAEKPHLRVEIDDALGKRRAGFDQAVPRFLAQSRLLCRRDDLQHAAICSHEPTYHARHVAMRHVNTHDGSLLSGTDGTR